MAVQVHDEQAVTLIHVSSHRSANGPYCSLVVNVCSVLSTGKSETVRHMSLADSVPETMLKATVLSPYRAANFRESQGGLTHGASRPKTRPPGVRDGVAVTVAVAVFAGVLVGVCVGVRVGVAVGVRVGVLVGVAVGVEVGVAVGVFDGPVWVGVEVGVEVGVRVGVFVGVFVGVRVGVEVGVRVGVEVLAGVLVGVWVGVLVGVGVPTSNATLHCNDVHKACDPCSGGAREKPTAFAFRLVNVHELDVAGST